MMQTLMLQKLINDSVLFGCKEVPFSLDKQLVVDSRQCARGDFFVAIVGSHFDGHDFLKEVAALPVAGVLVENRCLEELISLSKGDYSKYWWKKIPVIGVPNTRKALIDLAYAWRRQYDLVSVLVIGSNGKTTVKEMIASIFRAAVGHDKTLSSVGNFNNDIGLPLSLLKLRPKIKLAVFELGMNHPGETNLLANLAAPKIVLINNAQREHQEHMKSVSAVADEHASAIAALDDDGIVIIPKEDPFAYVWRAAAGKRRVIEFSLQENSMEEAELQSEQVVGSLEPLCMAKKNSRNQFFYQTLEIRSAGFKCKSNIHIEGKHNALNAVAAASVGIACNLKENSIAQGLDDFEPVAGRLRQTLLKDPPYEGVVLLDDSYNANPDSVRVAIDVIASREGKKILIFGDMGEIGPLALQEHQEVGCYAARSGIDAFFAMGQHSYYAWKTFYDRSVKKSPHGGFFTDHNVLLKALEKYFLLFHKQGQLTSLLIKGSFFMKMKRFVDHFIYK